MSEQAPEQTAEAPTPPPEGEQTEQKQSETFDKDYVEKLRKEAAKYRTEAKATASELEKVRQSSMSEAEKAVAEAEVRGRTAATQEFGKRLARSDFATAAARRNPDFDVAQALEYVDLGRFVGEDGEPDGKAISAAVERLVPAAGPQIPSFDGGARTAAPVGADMNSFIRKAAGRA